MAARPPWLELVEPRSSIALSDLDFGESQAIALAIETGADVLLIDDLAGRKEAVRRGLVVAGTRSVLDDAGEAGLLQFDDAVARVRNTSFRISRAACSALRSCRGIGALADQFTGKLKEVLEGWSEDVL